MNQNQWRSGNYIGGKDLIIDNHLDKIGTSLRDRLCHRLCQLQEEVLLDHKDTVVAVLFKQEGPGTITIILHLYMVVAHLDIEVAQVVHLHHKDIVVAVLLHQEDLLLQHLFTVPQLINSIEATAPQITENIKEVRQTKTRPLETPLGVNHTGEMQETLEMAPKDLMQKRSTPFKTLNWKKKRKVKLELMLLVEICQQHDKNPTPYTQIPPLSQ